MNPRARTEPDPRAALIQGFAALIERALRHAERVHQDHVSAVHEFRKALRRARGLVAFVKPICEPGTHTDIADLLREAFRTTGALRDGAVRLALLDQLHAAAALDPVAPAVHAVLKSELPTAERAALVLSAAAQAAAATVPRFETALGEALDMDALEAVLSRAARRVRRAFRRARKSGEDDAFHEWRKRLKDWRAVHELIHGWGDAGAFNQRRELAAMAQRLGALTDLILLQRTVQARSGGVAAGPLQRTLQRRIAARKHHALQWGERHHAQPPRLVAARLCGALEATWRGPQRQRAAQRAARVENHQQGETPPKIGRY